ncbi:nuclear transport factor 2 family protein [Micromonospora globispora]|uniref:nuclear transport factor 2 family protein n=1 Tax=Micromonospora globispora TaxID=1450148 RepID=UPI001402FC79|nr:nuclear transport factor 2 family protein [Micromonospora globispora]
MGDDIGSVPPGVLALEHRLGIQDVLNRYAYVVDAKAWDDLAGVFSDDATYDMSAVRLGVFDGLAAVRDQLASMRHPQAHFVLGVLVGEAGADGLVPVQSKYFVRLDDRTIMDGRYDDRLVLTGVGWRIRSRVIRRTGTPLPW